jgi:hypothetical protein
MTKRLEEIIEAGRTSEIAENRYKTTYSLESFIHNLGKLKLA